MRAWIFALALAFSGASGLAAQAQQPSSMNADQAYVRAVAYMQSEFAKMQSQDAETKARLVAAETELKRLRDQAKTQDSGAQTALSAFAEGDGAKGVDALMAQAKAKAKASAEDFKRAGALAFAVDSDRAIAAFESAVALSSDDISSAQQLEWLYERVGRYDEAMALAKRLSASNDPDAHARGLLSQCSVLRKRSIFATAEALCKQALDFSSAAGLKYNEGATLIELGGIANGRGDYPTAKGYYERALTISTDTGDKVGQAAALGNLGAIARKEDDLDTAESYAKRTLALDEELSFTDDKALTLVDLGNIAMRRDDLPLAEDFFKQALALGDQLGSKQVQTITTANLGQIAYRRGALDAAESYATRALNLDDELDFIEDKALTLTDLGFIALKRNDNAKACAYFSDSVATFESIGAGASPSAETPRKYVLQTCKR